MKIVAILATTAVCLGGVVAASLPPHHSPHFTKEVRLDTIGTTGFEIRRTIEDRTVGSPDPILTVRESLVAQRNLCPSKFDLQEIKISNAPPTLTYEAKIRCH